MMKTGAVFAISLVASVIGATIGGLIAWSIGSVGGMNEEDFWFRSCVVGWICGAILGVFISTRLTHKRSTG
jgi:hypothetical protein